MRKLIEYCLVSADGIVLDDPFPFQDYLDDAYLKDRLALFEACEASLWGRTTYERFAKTWAAIPSPRAYVARLGAMQKFVFSSKLATAAWNDSSIVRGDVATAVAELKQQEGGDLIVLGHGLLGEALLESRLIDAIVLTIHPVLVGQGKPFLRPGQAARLKLVDATHYSKLVKITYEPQY